DRLRAARLGNDLAGFQPYLHCRAFRLAVREPHTQLRQGTVPRDLDRLNAECVQLRTAQSQRTVDIVPVSVEWCAERTEREGERLGIGAALLAAHTLVRRLDAIEAGELRQAAHPPLHVVRSS